MKNHRPFPHPLSRPLRCFTSPWAPVLLAGALASPGAQAHVLLSNLTTPITAGGQSAFAIAGSPNEIAFNITHGCAPAESQPVFSGANLDTTKIEVTVPAAVVAATGTSLRPTASGLFGPAAVGAVDSAGNVKMTWTRKSANVGEPNYTASDNQLYKVGILLRAPAAASAGDTAIKKHQFLVVQTCRNGASDVVMDWGPANSPSLLVFPDRRQGFNKYTLDASTAADFATTGNGTLAARLKAYFGDAAIVWVGKSGYSANPNTSAKIQALAAKDASYSDLGAKAGASIAATDTLWVKY
jgi:periplasmic copper chaperone A